MMYHSQLVENTVNALTIDVEEWYQTILFFKDNQENTRVTNLLKNIHEILTLFAKYKAKATFFIVGSVAQKYPNLIKEIIRSGHEVASHGYFHQLAYRLPEKDFFYDVKKSLDILNDLTGNHIIGYRAPTWSITQEMSWAIDILKSLKLRYDSSMYPVGFGLSNFKRFPYEIKEDFVEFPPSVFQFLGCNFPFAGGTFLRLLPFDFIKNKISELNKKGSSSMVYFHSWEFDEQAPCRYIPKWKYLVQYSNVKSVKRKIEFLLKSFKFSSIKDILQIT